MNYHISSWTLKSYLVLAGAATADAANAAMEKRVDFIFERREMQQDQKWHGTLWLSKEEVRRWKEGRLRTLFFCTAGKKGKKEMRGRSINEPWQTTICCSIRPRAGAIWSSRNAVSLQTDKGMRAPGLAYLISHGAPSFELRRKLNPYQPCAAHHFPNKRLPQTGNLSIRGSERHISGIGSC